MRRAPLLALLWASGCAAGAPTVEAPVVTISPAAPAAPGAAPAATTSDAARDAQTIAALNTNGDVAAALGPPRPDPLASSYGLAGSGTYRTGMSGLGTGAPPPPLPS